ncbi:hypothetical protein AB0D59_36660 [Streptomyces sp. NPDC048417]|uniref:hypothetical protein n=1 Tax=Streptomyces sp. NPDC048417 TaxID=3155387 RepID=UPI00341F271F
MYWYTIRRPSSLTVGAPALRGSQVGFGRLIRSVVCLSRSRRKTTGPSASLVAVKTA